MSKFIEDFVEVLDDINDNDQFFEAYGLMVRKLYLGLHEAGFTKEEAFELMKTMDTPVKAS